MNKFHIKFKKETGNNIDKSYEELSYYCEENGSEIILEYILWLETKLQEYENC